MKAREIEQDGRFIFGSSADSHKTGWLVKDYIPLGGFYVVAAQPGVGKSWFLEALAVCVSRGIPFLGKETIGGDVLLIDEDTQPPELVKARLDMFGRGYPAPQKHKLFTRLCEGFLVSGGSTTSLTAMINRDAYKNVRLVVLDSLTGVVGGKSSLDNTKDASSIVEFLQSIGDRDMTVLAVHHISTKTSLSVDKAMTCDNPEGLVMNSTRLVSGSQGIYVLASPTKGGALETLFIRPVSRRILLPKPFSVKMCESDVDGNKIGYFELNGSVASEQSGDLSKYEKRLLSEFQPAVEYTVKTLIEVIEDYMHPNTLRNRLEVLEDKGYLDTVGKRGLGGAHHYTLTDKGIGFVEKSGVKPGVVSINPNDMVGKAKKNKKEE